MEWLESRQLKIAPPKRTKKITGTRFATILGLNPWSTPFEICSTTARVINWTSGASFVKS